MMNWVYLIFGLLTVGTFAVVVLDDVRARITQPDQPSPLSGLTFGDALLIGLYVLPIALGIVPLIHLVLTS